MKVMEAHTPIYNRDIPTVSGCFSGKRHEISNVIDAFLGIIVERWSKCVRYIAENTPMFSDCNVLTHLPGTKWPSFRRRHLWGQLIKRIDTQDNTGLSNVPEVESIGIHWLTRIYYIFVACIGLWLKPITSNIKVPVWCGMTPSGV